MPEVKISIGGREFDVACQEGEEHFLLSAAKLLDTEAQVLVKQLGRVPEARMLLMAGLMLADKTAGLEDTLKATEDRAAQAEARLAEIQAAPPKQVEVPIVPEAVSEGLAELAAQAEALADQLEEAADPAS